MKQKRRVAIITGGSGGIGLAVSRALAREKISVALIARRAAPLKRAVSVIRKEGGVAIAVRADIARPASAARAVRAVSLKLGPAGILVNCAGSQAPIGCFVENKNAVWERNIAVNLFGTARMCRAVLPDMIRRRRGVIINFSGGGAADSRPNFSAYAAAKAAVARLSEVLADELAGTGVLVNAVAPGAVNTAMLQEVIRAGRRAGDREQKNARERAQRGGVPPERAAALVCFLVSEKSRGLSGRLISAAWDPWEKWTKKDIAKIMKSGAYTLRRLKL